jgi:RNA 2',3'-cyclic 3'-phosphodiesterase
MSRGATARLFVAVDPPAEVRRALAHWVRAAPLPAGRLRLLDPELLHLTLLFLGSRPVGEIDVIASALEDCSKAVAELSVGAPAWLPARRPRTLAVEIHDPEGELADLQRTAAAAVARVSGWEPERRRFRAHITVARVPGGAAGDRRLAAAERPLSATPRLSFTPSTLTLYRSWLSPAGARYEPIATRELGRDIGVSSGAALFG